MLTIKFHVFCLGWKNPNPPSIPPRPDAPTPTASTSDPCRTCNHPLSDHITHLQHPVSLLKLGHITHLQHTVSLLKLGHITHLQHTVSLLKLGHITHLQHPVSLLKLGHITNLIILRLCNTVGVAAKCDHIGPDHNWWFYPNDNNNRIWSNKV
jgi:hypothetical protein